MYVSPLTTVVSAESESCNIAEIIAFHAGHLQRLFLIPHSPCTDSGSLAQHLLRFMQLKPKRGCGLQIASQGLWAPNCIAGTAGWRMRSISWCRWARHKGLDLARDGASAPWLVLPPCSPTHTLQEHLGRCHCTCYHGMRETKGAISLSL